jgi:hypothetical protein
MITVDRLIAEAETWIGTPVMGSGAVKGERCNCVGFCGGVARDLGLEIAWRLVEGFQGHALPPENFFLIKFLREHLVRVRKQPWRRGHLLLINTENNRPDATHLVLCTGPKSMINPAGKRVHPARIDKSVRIIEWYEIPGVTYD